MLVFLRRKGIRSVHTTPDVIPDHGDYKAALRANQRYLRRNGFLLGKNSGSVRIDPRHVAWRNDYIRAIIVNTMQPPRTRYQEVYTNKSYIHHHHRHTHDNLYHPSGPNDERTPNKGKRLYFVAAICGYGNEGHLGLVPNSLWCFIPAQKSHHKGDYHKVFNGENYLARFENQHLPNLHEPSLIILDNAAYHKVKRSDTPNANKLKKARVLKKLDEFDVQYHPNISAIEA